jgi:hypothetical protein
VSIVLTIPRWASSMDRGLAERLGNQTLEDLVDEFHPAPPLR